jgi:hypothetical protein
MVFFNFVIHPHFAFEQRRVSVPRRWRAREDIESEITEGGFSYPPTEETCGLKNPRSVYYQELSLSSAD